MLLCGGGHECIAIVRYLDEAEMISRSLGSS